MSNKVYSLIGLAKRAGKVVAGEDTCIRAVKSNKVFLVIVAEDASDNTKKEFSNACSYRGINISFFGRKKHLGRYVGKEMRAVIGVLDRGFSTVLKDRIDRYSIEFGGETLGKN